MRYLPVIGDIVRASAFDLSTGRTIEGEVVSFDQDHVFLRHPYRSDVRNVAAIVDEHVQLVSRPGADDDRIHCLTELWPEEQQTLLSDPDVSGSNAPVYARLVPGSTDWNDLMSAFRHVLSDDEIRSLLDKANQMYAEGRLTKKGKSTKAP